MGAYRDAQMFAAIESRASGFDDGTENEQHRVAHFLGVTIEDVLGIGSIDKEARLKSLEAIIVGATLKIEEVRSDD